MTEKNVQPNFEQVRKKFCQDLAYLLRNPSLTNEARLETLALLRQVLSERLPH